MILSFRVESYESFELGGFEQTAVGTDQDEILADVPQLDCDGQGGLQNDRVAGVDCVLVQKGNTGVNNRIFRRSFFEVGRIEDFHTKLRHGHRESGHRQKTSILLAD